MVIACHCEGTGWRFYGNSNLRSKFWGRSIQLDPEGIITLEFDDGEIFQWSKVLLERTRETPFPFLFVVALLRNMDLGILQVTTSIYNLILGKLYCDHYGTMRIQGNRGYSCKMKFKEQSIIDRNPHQVLSFGCIIFPYLPLTSLLFKFQQIISWCNILVKFVFFFI